MPRIVRFVLLLVLGLAALTTAAWVAIERTTAAWFEKDLNLRARLALTGIRPTLGARWDEGAAGIEPVLTELARDERILGACACSGTGAELARTASYPTELPCALLLPRVRDAAGELWIAREELSGTELHLSALPVGEDGPDGGFVVLVHDLAFVERREAKARSFLLLAFGVLALAAAGVTLIASRLSWRSWSSELRRFLSGGGERKEFQPILRDVRELVERMLAEATWTPERLRQTLERFLHGERVVCLANREPYIHERAADGKITVRHPASGLVTALEPVMRACSGTWVAHGGGSADRDTVDAHDRLRVPPDERSYLLRRVWLSPEEERGYYYGFANEGLWPLSHIAHARPIFRSADWEHYRAVNARFAEAVCQEVEGEDPIVLVQDYHFALAPQMIRERIPDATVIAFWHIPWPNSEHFGICPWRDELLQGMLGASILGFHTQFHCNNFLDSVDRFLEARIDREQNAVVQRGRSTLVRPYPISLEWPVHWSSEAPPAEECRARVFAELGLPRDALLGVGVDRLDYTKGIEDRFLAVERLLEAHPELVGRFTFAQLAAPSRTTIERYQALDVTVTALTERINARFARDGWRPIAFLRAHHEPPDVFRYYRAADVCYVSSLHDGMNLVAKEFVAARDDERGVLVLSQFTGAARELSESLVVNPYDLDQASAALYAALTMSEPEQRERLRAMRAHLSEFNVYRWAGRMLIDAARLRRRERFSRLGHAAAREPGNGGA